MLQTKPPKRDEALGNSAPYCIGFSERIFISKLVGARRRRRAIDVRGEGMGSSGARGGWPRVVSATLCGCATARVPGVTVPLARLRPAPVVDARVVAGRLTAKEVPDDLEPLGLLLGVGRTREECLAAADVKLEPKRLLRVTARHRNSHVQAQTTSHLARVRTRARSVHPRIRASVQPSQPCSLRTLSRAEIARATDFCPLTSRPARQSSSVT